MSMTVIQSVDPRSPAHRAGLRVGETLTHINGHMIVDVLDYKFYTYDPRLTLTLQEPDGSRRAVHIRKEEGEDLGLEFETYLMDRARSCANNCIFCFVDQMPKGMRKSLYFKDDDARLSFLMGNYLTLTNLSQREVQRIIDLRISPINVSVHTTDRELRCRMLKNRRAGESIDIMERFARNHITMNCQIVSCPGVNDGPALDRTLRDLAEMYPSVNSVSVVPVGVTKFREGLYPLRPYTREEADALIRQVEDFAEAHRARTGTRLVWCSDEFYLIAGRPIPEDEFYEDYCQLENGVGMLRLLQVEFKGALMTMDEVLRMDVDKALIIIRGKNVLEVDKYDYSKHPEAKKLRPSKAASHVPAWQTRKPQKKQASPAPPSQAAAKKPTQKKKSASTEKVVTVTKESIMKKKEGT